MTKLSVTGFSRLTVKELEAIMYDCEYEIDAISGCMACNTFRNCTGCPLKKIGVEDEGERNNLCEFYNSFCRNCAPEARKVLALVRREFSMRKGYSGKMGTISLPKKEVSKNQIYEEQILPLAKKIISICEENDISFIGNCDLGDETVKFSIIFRDSKFIRFPGI